MQRNDSVAPCNKSDEHQNLISGHCWLPLTAIKATGRLGTYAIAPSDTFGGMQKQLSHVAVSLTTP